MSWKMFFNWGISVDSIDANPIYILYCAYSIYIILYSYYIYILWVLYNYIKCLKIETTRRSQYLGPSLSWGNVSIAIKCLGCVCNLPNPSDLTVLSLIFLNLPVKPFQTIAVSWFSLGASIFLSTCRQSPETAAFAVSKFLRRVACAQAPRNCWIPWGTLAADFACENQLGIREMCRRTGDGCWISQKQLVLVTCLLSWSKWRDRKRKKKKGSVGVWRALRLVLVRSGCASDIRGRQALFLGEKKLSRNRTHKLSCSR